MKSVNIPSTKPVEDAKNQDPSAVLIHMKENKDFGVEEDVDAE